MAHNINIVNGKASMFYSGEKPWHSLGTAVEKALNSTDAIVAAGLDYAVQKEAIQLVTGGKVIDNHYATVRQDTRDVLGVVGRKYTVLQNKDAFRFFDGIVGVKEAMYQTAGALGAGEKIWLLAKLPGYVRTKGDDITEKYLLLSNTHDGSGSVDIMFTPIRVVCQNTLNLAIGSSSNRVRLRHTKHIGTRIHEVQEQLGIVNQRFSLLEELSGKLTEVKLGKKEFEKYLQDSGVVPKTDDQSTRAKNIIEEVSGLFENGLGTNLPGVRGTAWGAFNAVAEYVDHHRGDDLKKRSNSLLYGSGAILKQKAWTEALELAK